MDFKLYLKSFLTSLECVISTMVIFKYVCDSILKPCNNDGAMCLTVEENHILGDQVIPVKAKHASRAEISCFLYVYKNTYSLFLV